MKYLLFIMQSKCIFWEHGKNPIIYRAKNYIETNSIYMILFEAIQESTHRSGKGNSKKWKSFFFYASGSKNKKLKERGPIYIAPTQFHLHQLPIISGISITSNQLNSKSMGWRQVMTLPYVKWKSRLVNQTYLSASTLLLPISLLVQTVTHGNQLKG